MDSVDVESVCSRPKRSISRHVSINDGQLTLFTSRLLLECSVGSRFDTSIIILFSCRYRRAFFFVGFLSIFSKKLP